MEAANRIVINTVVQYIRSFVYMLLMLFSTRYVLAALGHSAYGVYSVIGSVVFMIGFVTQSLASSTQRFLSYSHGLKDKNELRCIFANAFTLHVLIALLIVLVMALCEPLFMGYLNIPANLKNSGSFVYYMVLIMVLLTFVTAPIRALYIARENIIYVSIVEILDAVLKLIGAIMLAYIPWNSLKLYAVLMASISVVNLLAYVLYAGIKYEEFHLPRYSEITKIYIQKLTGFAVWNVYSVGSTVARTQGLAIIINQFIGTIANAAYGIALQVSNAVGFIALSILNAVNPQLMKAEGAGNRERMLMLCTKESKYSFLVLSLLLIPLIMEMPGVLAFWLKDVPEYAVMFCRFLLIAYIMDQITIGLTSANQAIGKIRNYSLLISTTRLLTLPIAWYCLHVGLQARIVMFSYLGVEFIIGVMRIPFLKFTAGLNVLAYCSEVVLKCVPIMLGVLLISYIMCMLPSYMLRFVQTEIVGVFAGLILTYYIALSQEERDWLQNKIKRRTP